MFGWTRKLENYNNFSLKLEREVWRKRWMTDNIEERIIINFGTLNDARKVKNRQKVREPGIVAVEVKAKCWNVTRKGWYMTTKVWITPWSLAEVKTSRVGCPKCDEYICESCWEEGYDEHQGKPTKHNVIVHVIIFHRNMFSKVIQLDCRSARRTRENNFPAN